MKPFIDEYLAGRTPIPCTLCNNFIKFDQFLEMADGVGARADRYRPLRAHRAGRRPPAAIRCAAAWIARKDQTYFLFGLTQQQLARTDFPLGDMTKPQVRELARELGLPVAAKPDSQEICFVPNGDYAAFIDAYFRERGIAPEEDAGRDSSTPMAACWASMPACIISPSDSGAGWAWRPASRSTSSRPSLPRSA